MKLLTEGAVAWSPVQPINDIEGILKIYGKQITIVGGYNTNGAPSRLDATEEERRAEVRRVMDKYAPYGSFIISNLIVQGHTPEESRTHSMQLVDEARKYGKIVYHR